MTELNNPVSAAGPNWYPDPWGRYPARWWDGGQWTAYVYSQGDPILDLPTRPPQASATTAGSMSDSSNQKERSSRPRRWQRPIVLAAVGLVALRVVATIVGEDDTATEADDSITLTGQPAPTGPAMGDPRDDSSDTDSPPSDATGPDQASVDLAALDPTAAGIPIITTAEERADARAIISQVTTRGRANKNTYDRDLFGQAWSDATSDPIYGRNGCDTRNDILARDLDGVTFKPNTNSCVVLSGTYTSALSNETHSFSAERARDHHIDHVVPLAYAWQLGADEWDDERRRDFANDPLNLLLVEASLNTAKGDSDPASWLPPFNAGRCAYAVRFAAVSVKYNLPNTEANRTMMLAQCDG